MNNMDLLEVFGQISDEHVESAAKPPVKPAGGRAILRTVVAAAAVVALAVAAVPVVNGILNSAPAVVPIIDTSSMTELVSSNASPLDSTPSDDPVSAIIPPVSSETQSIDDPVSDVTTTEPASSDVPVNSDTPVSSESPPVLSEKPPVSSETPSKNDPISSVPPVSSETDPVSSDIPPVSSEPDDEIPDDCIDYKSVKLANGKFFLSYGESGLYNTTGLFGAHLETDSSYRSSVSDAYEVNGVDPNVMVCARSSDGSADVLIRTSALKDVKTGYDLLESKLNLSENFKSLQFESYESRDDSKHEVYEIGEQHREKVENFISLIEGAEFTDSVHITGSQQYVNVYLIYKTGMYIYLRVYECGYLYFPYGNGDYLPRMDPEYLYIGDGVNDLFSIFNSHNGTERADAPWMKTTSEYDDTVLGKYLPTYIPSPKVLKFTTAEYCIDTETAEIGSVKRVSAYFGERFSQYHVDVYASDNLSAVPSSAKMFDYEDLTLGIINSSTTYYGVWVDDIAVVIYPHSLTREEIYEILRSVKH